MTDFLWSLLIVESVGWLTIAVARNKLSYRVTSALFAGWLIGWAATDRHLFFALPAAALHTALYMALAWLVLVISRRIRPNANEWPRGAWSGWTSWSIIGTSFVGAYQFGAGASLIDGIIAVLVAAGLFSLFYAVVVHTQIKAETKKTRLNAAIDAQLEHMRANESEVPRRH